MSADNDDNKGNLDRCTVVEESKKEKSCCSRYLTLPFCGFLRPWKPIAGVILGTTCADPVFRTELHPYSAFGPATVLLSSKSTYLQIPTPTHKHEPGTAQGQNLLITNHLDQSIYVTNQEQVLDCAGAFASLSILNRNAESQPFFSACQANLPDLLHPKHSVQCVGGDAVRECRISSSLCL
jgi:hypothetical protein